MRIVGAGGELRVGYQVAGTIGAWAVTATPTEGATAIDAELQPVWLDPFWSTQRPMTVTLEWFGARRVWRNVAPETSGPTWRLVNLPAPEVS